VADRVGGKGNEGVSAFVQRLPGSIGYVEYAYAKQNKLTYASMQNKDGQLRQPPTTSLQGCRAGADWKSQPGFYEILTEPAGQGQLADHRRHLHPDAQDAGQAGTGAEVLKFFDWAYKNGAKMADELDYVPMPDAVKLVEPPGCRRSRMRRQGRLWK
jgi:phosphate transport system substrate-binding protein